MSLVLLSKKKEIWVTYVIFFFSPCRADVVWVYCCRGCWEQTQYFKRRPVSMPYSKRKTKKKTEEGLRRQEGDREDNCGTASLRRSKTNRQQMKPGSPHRSFFSRVDRNTPQGHAGDISLTWTAFKPLRMEQAVAEPIPSKDLKRTRQ